jgi:hypothetical protein
MKNLGFHSCKKGFSYRYRWSKSTFWFKCSWYFPSPSGSLINENDPSWRDIKNILCRHEDMVEGSRLNYTQLSRIVANQEQTNVFLLQKIEMLEKDKVQERKHENTIGIWRKQ